MPDYSRLLDFCLANQKANSLAFETAKYAPFLFLLTPITNPAIEPWQPLLFGDISNDSLTLENPPDSPVAPPYVEP